MKGRFAPSPTGRMHLGNLYAALLSWLSARKQGGTWLLRIEDLDPQRSRLEYALQLEDDLRWLGLDWDEGGTEGRGNCGPYIQSARGELYLEALRRLDQFGLVYPCTCTRADIMATQAPHESDGRIVYRGTCRPAWLTGGAAPADGRSSIEDAIAAVRIFVPDREIGFTDLHYGTQSINLAAHCGDFVIRRADGAWGYQLAVVVDDALMGVTEIVRGRDLLLSSPQQIYLGGLLGYKEPSYCHHPLICNESGNRLCKRDKSLDAGELRKGRSPEQILGMLAGCMGIKESDGASAIASISLKELLSEFSWDRVPAEDVILNY